MRREKIFVEGVVQGVGYRSFCEIHAVRLGLSGWCRNLPDGRVELEVEGDPRDLEQFVGRLREGPLRARVTKIDRKEMPVVGSKGFTCEIYPNP